MKNMSEITRSFLYFLDKNDNLMNATILVSTADFSKENITSLEIIKQDFFIYVVTATNLKGNKISFTGRFAWQRKKIIWE